MRGEMPGLLPSAVEAATDIAAGYSAAVDNDVMTDAELPATADLLVTLAEITHSQRALPPDAPQETPRHAAGFRHAAVEALRDITHAGGRVSSGAFGDAYGDADGDAGRGVGRGMSQAPTPEDSGPSAALSLLTNQLQRPGLSVMDAMTPRDTVRLTLASDKQISRAQPVPGPAKVYDRSATPQNLAHVTLGGDKRPAPAMAVTSAMVSTPAMQHANPVTASADAASGGGVGVLAQTLFKNDVERVALPTRAKVANPGAAAKPSQATRTLTAIATGIAPAKAERAALTFSRVTPLRAR